MNTTKIIEEVEIPQFRRSIEGRRIVISQHALDHLSTAQRKLFKEEELTTPILKEKPSSVGLQRNGRHAVFFRRDWGYLKVILKISELKVEVITFINTENIPNLKRLNDENAR